MSKSKKHIVLLTSEFPPLPGGIGNHAYNLAEHLQQSGYRVSVIADQRDAVENEAKFDSELQSKVYRIALKRSRYLMYLKRIWLCFKLSKSASFLICSGKFPLWIGAILKPIISARTIAVIHGTEVNFTNARLRKSINSSLRRFDKVIAVSNFTKALVEDLKLKSLTVISNGFSASTLKDVDDNSMPLKGSPKLLTVGNVTERKGQANVIKHLPILKEKYPNVHYHCVGFKTEADTCKDLAKSLGVLEHVTFHGHVTHQQIKSFYTNADICVMLSETTKTGDVEGFGIALIEANHFGLPTIGAKGCGIEDAVSHGKSGLLVNGHKTQEFIDAVTTILDDKSRFEEAAKSWSELHQWQYIIKRYIDFIDS
ncbi:glycosyltransferase family 4 protein [Winogradskyella haliclonae]|uniref:Glycoside hydrolase n=1 Tax=Winogradskyella haliclonae TaxID=2048558 RepID=A0ABQ2BZV5_9FLAO|nr:glycosyltransferase family 4 protein [Winogradskyella haliclonae]GGI58026.1 glycoside hydrolase [Winogradskyella haliclonae]